MPTAVNPQSDIDAWGKQYDADQEQQAEAQKPDAAEVLPTSVFHWMNGNSLGRATLSGIDTAVSTADSMYNSEPMRKARDVAAGEITGGANIADAGHSLVKATEQNFSDLANPGFHAGTGQPASVYDAPSPIWDHAKNAILDFRDAVAVQDPSLADNLVQGAAQLATPFAGYSRLLGGIHGVASALATGALTDATALGPHDPRTADMVALGRHTEGKLGGVLRTLAPDGSAVNAYVNFLSDRGNESEAEGRFKNVLDGFGANLIATPLIHSAAVVLKQGTAGLQYLAENGVRNTIGDLATMGPTPGSPAAQAGKIGFHGTPNEPFSEFDNTKIGSGQGAQSYGYGHYIAENAETGETYQKSLSGRMNNSAALSDAQAAIRDANGDKVKAYQNLTTMAASEKQADVRMRQQNAARIIQSGNADNGKGSLLKVDVDDKRLGSMLDLDKSMAQQPEVLNKIPMRDQQKLVKVLDDHGQDYELTDLTGNEFRQLLERAHNEDYFPMPEGKLYGPSDGSNAARDTSEYLSSHGVPGNKYLDRASRISGEGTRNYVVFDGKHIKVLGKEK